VDTQQADSRQALLLIVDDEHALRRLASEVLTRAGFTVVTANDGEEAVALVRRGGLQFDAVLLDMSMPNLSGADACRQIKELAPTLPVVLTSGYQEEDSALLAESGAAAAFVQKPFLPKLLVETMRSAVSGSASAVRR
jgi:two-component system, cell cycle sensor histidine kinase and response regulator CckA